MDLLHLLVAVIIIAIVWVIIERLLLPLIPDSTIQWLVRLLFAVVVIVWLLSLIWPGSLSFRNL
jgi:hypothetical protein